MKRRNAANALKLAALARSVQHLAGVLPRATVLERIEWMRQVHGLTKGEFTELLGLLGPERNTAEVCNG